MALQANTTPAPPSASEAEALRQLLLQYASSRPLRFVQWSPYPLVPLQRHICSLVLDHPRLVAYPPSSEYRRAWLKELVGKLERELEGAGRDESGEVEFELDEDLLSRYMDTLGPNPACTLSPRGAMDFSPVPSNSYITYFYPLLSHFGQQRSSTYQDDLMEGYGKITLLEEKMTISRGTTGLRTWEARGKRVLELGGGIGFLSMLIAQLQSICDQSEYKDFRVGRDDPVGRGQVWITDVDEEVLKRCRENVEINQLSSNTTVHSLDWLAVATHLRLSDAEEGSMREASGEGRKGTDMARWLQEEVQPDVIVAADVVYDPSLIPALHSVLHLALCKSSSRSTNGGVLRPLPEAYVASTVRNAETYATFLNGLARADLAHEPVELKTPLRTGSLPVFVGGEEAQTGDVRLLRIFHAPDNEQ